MINRTVIFNLKKQVYLKRKKYYNMLFVYMIFSILNIDRPIYTFQLLSLSIALGLIAIFIYSCFSFRHIIILKDRVKIENLYISVVRVFLSSICFLLSIIPNVLKDVDGIKKLINIYMILSVVILFCFCHTLFLCKKIFYFDEIEHIEDENGIIQCLKIKSKIIYINSFIWDISRIFAKNNR